MTNFVADADELEDIGSRVIDLEYTAQRTQGSVFGLLHSMAVISRELEELMEHLPLPPGEFTEEHKSIERIIDRLERYVKRRREAVTRYEQRRAELATGVNKVVRKEE